MEQFQEKVGMLIKLKEGGIITEDEFNAQYNNEDGNTYWTTWYEDSLSYNIDTNDAKGAFPNAAFYK